MKKALSTGFQPAFKVQGIVYHLIGSLIPNENESPKFAQIYFMNDKEEQIETRMASNDVLRSNVIEELQFMMDKYNSYTKSFKQAIHKMDCINSKVYIKFVHLTQLIKNLFV